MSRIYVQVYVQVPWRASGASLVAIRGGIHGMIVRSTPSHGAAVLIVIAMALAGCHSGTTRGSRSTQSPASPAPAPSAIAAANAIAAYQGMWKAVIEAAKVPDPDAADLRRYASDDALKLIVGNLVADRDQGKVVKGTLITNPTATAVQPPDHPTQATITDCVDD